MKCRHCGMELEEGTTLCPNCQMNTAKPKIWQVSLFSVLGFLVAFILTLVIMKDQGVNLGWMDPSGWFKKEPQQAVQETESLYNYGLNRESYTSADTGTAATVVATIGDINLTNAELNGYYWTGVYNFMTQYSYYLEYFGLDLTKPLDQQAYLDTGDTWQKTFLENALTEWHKYSALALQGRKEGYELSEEKIQQLEDTKKQVESNISANGYSNLDEMIQAELGPLCNAEAYWLYMETYFYAMDYFESKYPSLEPTEAEVEAYFDAHAEELDYTKETKKHNVRHILIEPKGGTENETGTKTYTDAEWEACRKEAQAILDSWDGTEEGFAKLAKEKTADTGSAETGGLYEGLTESTNFVEEFKYWYLDPERKPGDTGLVTSVYGYHIMYYSSNETVWQENTKSLLWQENSDAFVEKTMKAWPVTIYDDLIAIGEVKLS